MTQGSSTSIAFRRLPFAPFLVLALLLAVTTVSAQRLSGVVSSSANGTVWLDDGTSFAVTDATRVVVSRAGSMDDLQTGQYVAITATLLADGSLLASMVNIFPESQRRAFGGQFEQASGNLMTNASVDDATIDVVSGSELTVSFQGQTQHVIIPPTAQISVRSDGTTDDIQPGVRISATLSDGAASSVTLTSA